MDKLLHWTSAVVCSLHTNWVVLVNFAAGYTPPATASMLLLALLLKRDAAVAAAGVRP
jgi:hypothetical protein